MSRAASTSPVKSAAIEHLGGLGEPPTHEVGGAERRHERGEQDAGGAAHRQRALGVLTGVVVAVEVELRGAEVRRGVDPPRQLLVKHRIDDGRGPAPVRLRCLDLTGERAREGQHPERGRGEALVADGLRDM